MKTMSEERWMPAWAPSKKKKDRICRIMRWKNHGETMK
jgi:hypothetical protein